MTADRNLPDLALRAGLVALAALLAPPLAAQPAPGDYRAVLEHELDKTPAQIDFVRLRQLYAASPEFGTATGTPAELEHFPLLDTHLAAITRLEAMDPPPRQALTEHELYARGILSAILASRTEVEGRMVFPVLTAAEETEVLRALWVRSTGETRVTLAGGPHDCHEVEPDPAHTPHTDDPPTPAGPVCFDVSALAG